MKKIFIIALLFLTTSAFCINPFYISGGYSQTLAGTTPVGDMSTGISFKPFNNYDMEIGIDILHFQLAPTDRFQTVSDESLIQLPSLILALPFASSALNPYCMSRCGLHVINRYIRILQVTGFLLHGSLYFPVVPNSYFGFINKHRFVTEIITKGWHKESFTFQDDIGLRLQIKPNDEYVFFIDGGFRIEKNFSRDLEKKWFAQAGLTRD